MIIDFITKYFWLLFIAFLIHVRIINKKHEKRLEYMKTDEYYNSEEYRIELTKLSEELDKDISFYRNRYNKGEIGIENLPPLYNNSIRAINETKRFLDGDYNTDYKSLKYNLELYIYSLDKYVKDQFDEAFKYKL